MSENEIEILAKLQEMPLTFEARETEGIDLEIEHIIVPYGRSKGRIQRRDREYGVELRVHMAAKTKDGDGDESISATLVVPDGFGYRHTYWHETAGRRGREHKIDVSFDKQRATCVITAKDPRRGGYTGKTALIEGDFVLECSFA